MMRQEPSSVLQMIADAEPVGPMISWLGYPGTVRRCYEKVSMPDGISVLGDALASLNPRFGTGVSVAALQVCQPMHVRACLCTPHRPASAILSLCMMMLRVSGYLLYIWLLHAQQRGSGVAWCVDEDVAALQS